jgi:hypothetical protein
VVLAGAALALVAPVLPAHAETLAQRDARDDVWHDGRPESDPYLGEPDFGEYPDLHRVTYRHTDTTARIRLKMEDMRRFGYRLFEVRMKTDEGEHRRVTLFRDTGSPETRGLVEWFGSRSCDVGWKVDLSEDTVLLVVPRPCLSNPEEVSFRLASNYWPTSDDFPYRDLAGTSGFDFEGWTAPVATG